VPVLARCWDLAFYWRLLCWRVPPFWFDERKHLFRAHCPKLDRVWVFIPLTTAVLACTFAGVSQKLVPWVQCPCTSCSVLSHTCVWSPSAAHARAQCSLCGS
jgi:hypothetical protein